MTLRSRLRAPLPLLITAVVAALVADYAARLLPGPSLEPEPLERLLGLGLRSLLWLGLATTVGLGSRGAARRAGLALAGPSVGLATGGLSLLAVQLFAGQVDVASLPPDPAGLSPPLFALISLAAVVLAPLGEELLFRGALYAGIRDTHGERAAVLGSAAAFALFHFDPVHFGVAAIAGLALGALRAHGGRLWPCVLAHACHNLLWLISAWVFG